MAISNCLSSPTSENPYGFSALCVPAYRQAGKVNCQPTQLLIAETLATIGYGKGTSFTKLKGHSLHFFGSNLRSKSNYYALESNNNYGTKN